MNTIAETNYGLVEGVLKQDIVVYRGIPYAAPPVGPLRWKKPQPPKPWSVVKKCTRFAGRCVQGEQPEDSLYTKEFYQDQDFLPPQSEDCLYLNIWTPAERPKHKLPVAVWIHGGAFMGGYGSELEFDGTEYCRNGVILVTINYRLGPLGFFAHGWLNEESSTGTSGNYGIFDQLAALAWVRDNISGFGGDADNVTVFGQSAGAMSAQIIACSHYAKGLAHKVILQSGGGLDNGFGIKRTLKTAQCAGALYAQALGAKSLQELREIPAEQLIEAIPAFVFSCKENGIELDGPPFAPCVDGDLLEGEDSTLVKQGKHLPIPYLLGCTSKDLGHRAGAQEMPPLLKGCVEWSYIQEKLGRGPCYVYYFTHEPLGDSQGAFHSSELWYTFGTLQRSWRPKCPEDYRLSQTMLEYWCNFMKTGNPNQPSKITWPPCSDAFPFIKEFV